MARRRRQPTTLLWWTSERWATFTSESIWSIPSISYQRAPSCCHSIHRSNSAQVSVHFHSKFVVKWLVGWNKTENRDPLSIKYLLASFCSPSFIQNVQNLYQILLKPEIKLFSKKYLFLKVPNFKMILILYWTFL